MIRKFKSVKVAVIFTVVLCVVGVGDAPSIKSNEVKAETRKAHCIITNSGDFFCEGNPAYEEAISE